MSQTEGIVDDGMTISRTEVESSIEAFSAPCLKMSKSGEVLFNLLKLKSNKAKNTEFLPTNSTNPIIEL